MFPTYFNIIKELDNYNENNTHLKNPIQDYNENIIPNPNLIMVERNPINMSKFQLWFCSLHLCLLMISVVMLILVSIIISYISYSEAEYFKNIYVNWQLSPIDNLGLNSCNKSLNILQEEWPGTINGCNCYFYIRRGLCSRRSICMNIYSRSSIPFILWRGNRICAERGSYKNYLKLNIHSSSINCPPETRSCGIIDSQNNHLCVDKLKNCPVVDLAIYSRGFSDSNIIQSKSNLISNNSLENIYLGKNDSLIKLSTADLVYSLNETKFQANLNNIRIPIQFKISNGQPCENPFYENLNFSLYILDSNYGKQFCYRYKDEVNIPDDDNIPDLNDSSINSTLNDNGFINSTSVYVNNNENFLLNSKNSAYFYDYNFKAIDKYYMESLYYENGITGITYNLPKFPVGIYQRDIYLYARNYFGLKIYCLKKIKDLNVTDTLLDDLELISNFSDNYGILVTSLIFSILCFIFYIFLICFGSSIIEKKKKKKEKKEQSEREKTDFFTRKYSFCYLGISFLFVLLIMGYLIPFIVVSTNIKQITIFDLIFSDINCVEEFSVDLYNRFILKSVVIKKLNIVCIAIGSFMLFLQIIFSLFCCCLRN